MKRVGLAVGGLLAIGVSAVILGRIYILPRHQPWRYGNTGGDFDVRIPDGPLVKGNEVIIDIPPGWQCGTKGGGEARVCSPPLGSEPVEGIIISANQTGYTSLEQVEAFLQREAAETQRTQPSAHVYYLRRRNINGSTWIDSLRFTGTEWRRDVITLYKGAGKQLVHITARVSDAHYRAYASDIERAVASLKQNTLSSRTE